MDALVREIGARGRADVVTSAPPPAPPAADTAEADSEDHVALYTELQSLTMRDMLRQAREAEIHEDDILDSQDAGDPKKALVALLVQARLAMASNSEVDDSGAVRDELEAMRMRDLVARARECGVGEDELLDAPKAAVVELLTPLMLRMQ